MIAIASFHIFTLSKAVLDKLDFIPEGFFYYGFAIVFKGDARIDEGSIIKRVAPEGGV